MSLSHADRIMLACPGCCWLAGDGRDTSPDKLTSPCMASLATRTARHVIACRMWSKRSQRQNRPARARTASYISVCLSVYSSERDEQLHADLLRPPAHGRASRRYIYEPLLTGAKMVCGRLIWATSPLLMICPPLMRGCVHYRPVLCLCFPFGGSARFGTSQDYLVSSIPERLQIGLLRGRVHRFK